MKLRFYKLPAILWLLVLGASETSAQCPGGYNQAQLNWDCLDYYYNSGSGAPYQSFVSTSQEMTQRFAIGTTWCTFYSSSSALIQSSENATHTGDLAGYTGQDMQFNPSAASQNLRVEFNEEVYNVSFTLYDIDRSQRIDVDAEDDAANGVNVNFAVQGGSILTISNNNSTTAYVTASSTSLGNSSNQGSATVTIAGPVKEFTITVTNVGSDAVFWLSDINACVPGTLPTDYHKLANNQPFQGPFGDQPDYFLVTPDNDRVYMVNSANGEARTVMVDPERDYVNSFAYDPYNHYLYYISENVSIDANNKELKRYDFTTETSSTLVADVETAFNIPVMNYGIESAGAAFYNGSLYFGIEGGRYSSGSGTVTRESIIWRLDFDGSGNPLQAVQVFATDAYQNGSNTSVHDWGDFIIRDGILYNFNTARNGSNYSQSKYHHFDMMTGGLTLYSNPGSSQYNGQSAMTWAGDLYYVRDVIAIYNEDGTNDATQHTLTTIDGGPAWQGGAGDASDPFRPKCDFGDAPASYDPNPVSPAVHERSDEIRIGATWGAEWNKSGDANADLDGDEDGIAYLPIFSPTHDRYLTSVDVYNNSGSDAILCAWLDYDGDGVFEASEGIPPQTVPSSGSMQSFYLFWNSAPSSLPNNSVTYLRVRITSSTYPMNENHPTGYIEVGEVEDYRIVVDDFPLEADLLSFRAYTQAKTVQVEWTASEKDGFNGYELQRSSDGTNWQTIRNLDAQPDAGTYNYNHNDNTPLSGESFYRLKLNESNGMFRYSEVKKVYFGGTGVGLVIRPNPARERATLQFNSITGSSAQVRVLTENGKLIHNANLTARPGQNLYELPVKQWPAGSYIVQLNVDGLVRTSKIIVSK